MNNNVQPRTFLIMIIGILIGIVFLVPILGFLSLIFIVPPIILLGILFVLNKQASDHASEDS